MGEPPDETRSGEPLDQGEMTARWSPAGPGAPGTQFAPAGSPWAAPVTSPPVRDRLAVHLTWEGVLLVLTAVLLGVALASTPEARLADIVSPAGYLGLVAAGLALSLRTGTPNLAVGSIATATGVIGAHLAATDGWSLWTAMTAAVALALATGLVTGLIVAALSVPAWAVTLGLTLLVQAAALKIANGQLVVFHASGSYSATPWLVLFALVSIAGGALWLVPGVRTALSATRNSEDPGQWAGLPAGLGAVAGLTGSSLLAGLGGVSLALYLGVGDPVSGGINLTLVAFAAVLVGGVSVFGRRAGVFGTVLGVIVAESLLFIMNTHDLSSFWLYVPIGGLAVLGLCVSRALEGITDALNRQRPAARFAPAGFVGPGPAAPPGGSAVTG